MRSVISPRILHSPTPLPADKNRLLSKIVFFPQQLMVTTPNGRTGQNVASLVEEGNRAAQELAQIPLLCTVGRIARAWDQLMTRKSVTQTPAVSS